MEFVYLLLYFSLFFTQIHYINSLNSKQIFDIIHEKEILPVLKVKNIRNVKSIIHSSEMKGQHSPGNGVNDKSDDEDSFSFYPAPESIEDDINFLQTKVKESKEKMKDFKKIGDDIVKKEKKEYEAMKRMFEEVKTKIKTLSQELRDEKKILKISADKSLLSKITSEYKEKFEFMRNNAEDLEQNIAEIEKSLSNSKIKNKEEFLKVDVGGNINSASIKNNTADATMQTILAQKLELISPDDNSTDNASKTVSISASNDMLEIENENLPLVISNKKLDPSKDIKLPVKDMIKFTKLMKRLNDLCGDNFTKCLTSKEEEKMKKEERVNQK